MSISGVSPFAPLPTKDLYAEFARQREIHAKGPAGYGQSRVEGEPRPSVGASALADPAATDVKGSAALQKINISV